jgi:hypothetical protein
MCAGSWHHCQIVCTPELIFHDYFGNAQIVKSHTIQLKRSPTSRNQPTTLTFPFYNILTNGNKQYKPMVLPSLNLLG